MARNDLQVNIRMSAPLKSALDEAAAANGRSLNSELNRRLELSLSPATSSEVALAMAAKDAQIARLDYRVAELETDYAALAKSALALLRAMENQELPASVREAAEQLEKEAIGDWGLGGLGDPPHTDVQLYQLWKKAEKRRAEWRLEVEHEKAVQAAKKAYEALLRPGPKVDPLE